MPPSHHTLSPMMLVLSWMLLKRFQHKQTKKTNRQADRHLSSPGVSVNRRAPDIPGDNNQAGSRRQRTQKNGLPTFIDFEYGTTRDWKQRHQ